MSCETLLLGALTSTSVRACVRLSVDSDSTVLACRQVGTNVWVRSDPVATAGNVAFISVNGLTPNTSYTCRVEPGTRATGGHAGAFKTLPAGTNVSFTAALCGDANTGSNHAVFDRIRLNASGAHFLIHHGDMHYRDDPNPNVGNYLAAWDEVFRIPRQGALYASMPLVYTWDDHDFGVNNSDGTSAGRDHVRQAYRLRFPSYPLAEASATEHIGHAFTIGRVRFVVTDQRSASSTRGSTDNASKTILGATQKAWFKSEVSAAAAAGQLIVWVCSRLFGGNAETGADHWGGFTTERRELVDYIHANAPGRVIVLSADMHAMRIGSHDFATGGGEPLMTFQVATLDHGTIDGAGYGGVSSAGAIAWSATNGIFGTMQVTDVGGSTIGIVWKGFNSSGTQVMTHSFDVNV